MKKENKNLVDLLEIVSRRKWVLMAPVLAGLLIGGLLGFLLPPSYRSTTLILVEQQQVPESYVTPTDRTPFSERLNTIKQQILSRTKLEQIIKDFNLYRDEDTVSSRNPVKRILANAFKGRGAKEDLIERLRDDIEIKVMGESKRGGDAFSINFTGRDPEVTMQVTNTLASFFIDENLKAREEYAEGTSEFLANELERAKHELTEQERSLRRFKEYYMGSLPEQLDANLRTLDRLQIDLQVTTNSVKNAEERKNFLEEQLNLAKIGKAVIAINPLVIELERLKGELSALLSIYKDTYPDVAIMKNKIHDIETQLGYNTQPADGKSGEGAPQNPMGFQSIDINTELSQVNSRLQILRQREAEIIRQIKSLEQRVEQTPANEQRLADVRRDYDISLKNYQALLEKKLNARLAENMEKRQKGERFRVLDPANLPEKPSKPDKLKITLLGLFMGLGAGVFLMYAFEFFNPAFRKAEELSESFPYPVLAVIPEFMPDVKPKAEKGRLKLIKG
jgi:polysaccharide chain length determinant protein (PEP-CTERM system associated)